MSKKKVLLSVLAVVLICTISVAGTLAFLTKTTGAVENTFTAADDLGNLTLNESKAEVQPDGSYKLSETAEKVMSNSYTVAPGATYPKDPTVHVIDKTATPAYLYLEVVDNTPETVTFAIDNMWMELPNVTGDHGGKIYVLHDNNAPVILTGTGNEDTDYNVLVNKQITTTNEFATNTAQFKLTFYAYMGQASAGTDAASAFTACFGK